MVVGMDGRFSGGLVLAANGERDLSGLRVHEMRHRLPRRVSREYFPIAPHQSGRAIATRQCSDRDIRRVVDMGTQRSPRASQCDRC